MAMLQVSTAPSRSAYDAVDRLLHLADDRPAGLVVHSAAELADGSVVIVDVWESADAMDAFERTRLFPAFAETGMPMGEPPTRHTAFQLVR